MLAYDCSNPDVPKSKPTLHKRPETSQQDIWILKGVQRTSMLILERVWGLENRDKLSERRITWYFWLKCWFLPSRKALTMYPSLIRWETHYLYITRHQPSYFPLNFNETPPGAAINVPSFCLCNALKAAMFIQGGTLAWELSGKQAIVYTGSF